METSTPPLLEGYLTTDEAARGLHVHWRTLKRWQSHGNGPPQVRIGRRVYYRRDDIAAWLTAQGSALSEAPVTKGPKVRV